MHICRPRSACRSLLSSSSMWVPGIKRRSSQLVADAFTLTAIVPVPDLHLQLAFFTHSYLLKKKKTSKSQNCFTSKRLNSNILLSHSVLFLYNYSFYYVINNPPALFSYLPAWVLGVTFLDHTVQHLKSHHHCFLLSWSRYSKVDSIQTSALARKLHNCKDECFLASVKTLSVCLMMILSYVSCPDFFLGTNLWFWGLSSIVSTFASTSWNSTTIVKVHNTPASYSITESNLLQSKINPCWFIINFSLSWLP